MDAPKYNMAHNPVYQIDFSAVESGKRVAASKRRVRFRFGFSNSEAISAGLTGTECRGEEHEVTLVWSLTSGKRLVLADGHEVHFSKGNMQQTKFETTWTMRGQHTVKIVAFAAPPLFVTPGFRQFELFIDGMSFFAMPKIYELGKSNTRAVVPATNAAAQGGAAYNNYSLPPQQEASYQEYVYAQEQRHQMNRGLSMQDAVSEPADATSFARPPTTRTESMPSDLMSDPTPVMDMQDHLAAPVALLDQGATTVATHSTHDEFTPVAPAPQEPSLANIHTEILGAYGGPVEKPALPALAAEPHTQGVPVPMVTPTNASTAAPPQTAYPPTTAGGNLVSPVSAMSTPSNFYSPPEQQPVAPVQYQQQYQQPPVQQYYQQPPVQQYHQQTPVQQYHQQTPVQQYQQPPVQQYHQQPPVQQYHEPPVERPVEQQPPEQLQPAPQLSMIHDYKEPMVEEGTKVDAALKNLVNLDDITQDPETPEKQKQRDIEKQQEEALARKRSKPVPPAVGAWHLGPQPSLDNVKETAPPKQPPNREVMKMHAFDPAAAQAGMMVVYGQAPPQHYHQPGFYGVASRAY